VFNTGDDYKVKIHLKLGLKNKIELVPSPDKRETFPTTLVFKNKSKKRFNCMNS